MKTSCYYKDLEPAMQDKVNVQWRQKELKRRESYYSKDTNESDYPWYFKTDYINSWTYSDNYLFSLCPVCGLPEVFSSVLNEVGYESRTVTTKCKCGNIYQYGD
jgi:hypothetical protein